MAEASGFEAFDPRQAGTTSRRIPMQQVVDRLLATLVAAGGEVVDPAGQRAASMLNEASGLGLSNERVGAVLRTMDQQGLVERSLNGKRTKRVIITPAGRAALRAAEAESVAGPEVDPEPEPEPEVETDQVSASGRDVDVALGLVEPDPVEPLTLADLDESDLEILGVLAELGSFTDNDRACLRLAERTSLVFCSDFIDQVGALVAGGLVEWDQVGDGQDRRTNRIEISAAGRALLRAAAA